MDDCFRLSDFDMNYTKYFNAINPAEHIYYQDLKEENNKICVR